MAHALHFYLNNKDEEVTEIIIPNSINEIGDYQFYGFNNITKLDINSNINSIGKQAFDSCDQLDYYIYDNGRYLGNKDNSYAILISVINPNEPQIKIPSSIQLICKGALDQCKNLQYNTFNDGEYLGNEEDETIVFMHPTNDNVSSIVLSSSTKIIYDNAFTDAYDLSEIEIPNSLMSIGSSALYDCFNLETIHYNGNLTQWCHISFSDTTSNPMCHNGHFYQKENNEWKELTSLNIPEGVTNIGNYQFYYFTFILEVILPSTIEKIGDFAFGACKNIKKIELKEGIKIIGSSCFTGCQSIESIVLPSSLEIIGDRIFNMNQSLSKIYFNGTEDEWNNIVKASNNTELFAAKVFYFSSSEPTNDGNYWHYEENEIVEW